jgi:hypothetical protein
VLLGFDEMKVREGLVFDNATGNIVGYVDTGDMNQLLKSFESNLKGQKEPPKEVATHMLAVCVRGIFLKLDFPLGQFSTLCMCIDNLHTFNITFIIQYSCFWS